MSDQKPTATINPSSARHYDWVRVFGSGTVPIKSAYPQPCRFPDLGIVMVYWLDIDRLSPNEIAQLCEHLVERFPTAARGDVEAKLRSEGCPILADDVTVMSDDLHFL
jgi:hypothetical protein